MSRSGAPWRTAEYGKWYSVYRQRASSSVWEKNL